MSVAEANKTPGPFSGWTEVPRKVVAIELAERLLVFGLFVHFLNNMIGTGAASISAITLLIIASETLPLVLMFARGPSSNVSMNPSDWAFGVAGASLPLLAIAPQVAPLAPVWIGITIMTVGLSIQVMGKFFLGRSFGIVAANRGVKMDGPYRIVRHPIYAGYTLTHIGFFTVHPCWQNAIIYVVGLSLQVVRILREEQVLNQDPSYREFTGQVRWRLLPGVF